MKGRGVGSDLVLKGGGGGGVRSYFTSIVQGGAELQLKAYFAHLRATPAPPDNYFTVHNTRRFDKNYMYRR